MTCINKIKQYYIHTKHNNKEVKKPTEKREENNLAIRVDIN